MDVEKKANPTAAQSEAKGASDEYVSYHLSRDPSILIGVFILFCRKRKTSL